MKNLLTILMIIGIYSNLLSQEVKLNTNLVVESDGTLRMDGNATAFTDLVVPVTAVRLGSGNSPQFVSMKNNGSGSRGVYTFTFENQTSASNEQEVFFSIQMPHNWKEGSAIYPHVHWSPQTATTGSVVWGFEYSWVEYNPSTPLAFPNTTLETVTTAAIAAGDVDKHFITPFSSITPTTSQDNISGIIMCRFWRKSADAADTYGAAGTANAALLSFDVHYEIDGIGSHTEYVK